MTNLDKYTYSTALSLLAVNRAILLIIFFDVQNQ